MTCKRVIVVSIDQLKTDDFWHIKHPLVVEHPVKLFSAFFQLCGSNFLSLEVGFL